MTPKSAGSVKIIGADRALEWRLVGAGEFVPQLIVATAEIPQPLIAGRGVERSGRRAEIRAIEA
jgi:hypothetical protein